MKSFYLTALTGLFLLVATGISGVHAQESTQIPQMVNHPAMTEEFKAMLASLQIPGNQQVFATANDSGPISDAGPAHAALADTHDWSDLIKNKDSDLWKAFDSLSNEPVGEVKLHLNIPPSQIPPEIGKFLLSHFCSCYAGKPSGCTCPFSNCCPVRFSLWKALLDFLPASDLATPSRN